MSMAAPVITFYSYKGGVGRTQALANVAVRLANAGKRVVVVDMDLESPGVHAFFSPPSEESRNFQERDFSDRPGVVDYLERCSTLPEEEPTIEGMLVPCSHRFLRSGAGEIRLLPPGRLDDTYVERLAAFSWERFYSEQRGYAYVELLRQQLCRLADVVLVDSRTGLTDAGMVCTFQLPDVVVVLFALHRQGIEGAERMAKAIAQRHEGAPGGTRARRILLVPSRVDDAAEMERAEQFLGDARSQLGPIAHCELLDGHRDRIPYLAFFAYGENIVDPQADNRLSAAYQRLTEHIEHAVDLRSPPPPAPRADEDAPLFAVLDRENAEIRKETLDLVRAVRASWDPQEPLDRLARHASDILYRQAEVGRRIGMLSDQLRHLETIDEGAMKPTGLVIPTTLAGWEPFADSVNSVVFEARAAFFAHVKQRIRNAASGDASVVDTLWAEAEKSIADATATELRSRVTALEARARRSTLDAQLQRGTLEHAALAARYRTAKERVLWLDERIQRLMDQGDLTAESAAELANLLRLRVADRREEPLVPNHWSGYDVLCMLLAEQKEQSDAAFKDIGFALWSDAWSAFFEGGSTSPFAAAGVDCQRQLERISAIDTLIAPLVNMIAAHIQQMWLAIGPSREQTLRLFSERRTDPCLQGAIARLAVDHDNLTDLYAVWLMDLVPFDAPAFRMPLRRVLEHLAMTGRPGEAYYGLLAVGAQDPSILDDHSFFFAHAALMEALVNMPEATGVAEPFLYDGAFSERLAMTPHGAALLVIVACGLEGRPRSTSIRNAARLALQQFVVLDLPPALDLVVSQPAFADPKYAATTLQLVEILARLQSEGERPIYPAWSLHTYYETELQKFFADERQRIRELPVGITGSLSLSMSANEWMDVAFRIVSRDHIGDPPMRGAREKIVEIFDQANAHLQRLSELTAALSSRGRTIGQAEADATLVRNACAAIAAWLDGASGQPWLAARIRDLWEVAP